MAKMGGHDESPLRGARLKQGRHRLMMDGHSCSLSPAKDTERVDEGRAKL
jgi:hypothetical protein